MQSFLYRTIGIGVSLLISSCAIFQRSEESGLRDYRDQESSLDSSGYRSLNNTLESRSQGYSYLNREELSQLQNQKKIHQLEKSLSTRKSQEQYSRVLPLLKSDQEKIDFLSLVTLEEKQAWLNRNDIWKRVKPLNSDYKNLVDSQDVAVGMTQDMVRKSWGEPVSVETSGNPLYKNERWKYSRYITLGDGFKQERRFVFFEGGRVVGWETE